MDASQYSATAKLRDGTAITIRAQRPTDREGMRDALVHMGQESITRRFFAPRRYFSESEVSFFLNIDFVQQVALLAVSGETVVGGCRYIVTEPGEAEVAFSVADDWQGRGIGGLLMEHLMGIARTQGLRRLVAETLPENERMLAVFQKSGMRTSTSRQDGVVRVSMTFT